MVPFGDLEADSQAHNGKIPPYPPAQLYRILLRCQDAFRLVHGPLNDGDISPRIDMVVGEDDLLFNLRPCKLQEAAIIGGISDSRQSCNRPSLDIFQGQSFAPIQIGEVIGAIGAVEDNGVTFMGRYTLLQCPTITVLFNFGHDKEIGSAQLSEGLPQGPPGEQATVTEPGLGINKEDIYIPFDPEVLKSIVQYGHMGMKVGTGVLAREITAATNNNGDTLEPLSKHVGFIACLSE